MGHYDGVHFASLEERWGKILSCLRGWRRISYQGVVAAAKARGQTRELDPVVVEVLRDGSAKNRLSIHPPVFLWQQFSDAVHDEVGVLAQLLAPYPAAFG